MFRYILEKFDEFVGNIVIFFGALIFFGFPVLVFGIFIYDKFFDSKTEEEISAEKLATEYVVPENPDYTLIYKGGGLKQTKFLKKGSVVEISPGVFKAHIHTIPRRKRAGIEVFDGNSNSIIDTSAPHRSFTEVMGFNCKNHSMRNFREMYYGEEFPSEESLVRLNVKDDRWERYTAYFYKDLNHYLCKLSWKDYKEVDFKLKD